MPSKKTKKKTHGIFYTPDQVATLLCNWAIQSPSDTVLEPSFGGCGFLRATNSRFVEIGLNENEIPRHVFGCDIDPVAFEHLRKIYPNSNGHFIQDDFLGLQIENFPSKENFSIVIGNPPYVSHHNMLPDQKKAAWEWLENSSFDSVIDRRASLWVYFVLHGLSFLKEGGRVVWVLPGSFLHADYSNQVRKILQHRFKRILSIVVGSRLFIEDGTEEISIFLLGDGYLPNAVDTCKTSFAFANSTQEVPQIINAWEQDQIESNTITLASLMPLSTQIIYKKLELDSCTISLGDIFDIRIGIVSGANDFFIMNKNEWKKHRFPNTYETLILTRFKDTNGLEFTSKDMKAKLEAGSKNILFDTSRSKQISKSAKRFLDQFPAERLQATTFQRRGVDAWHRFNDNKVPDAYLPYMNNEGPRFVINKARATSTNSVHRLFYFNKQKIPGGKELILKQTAISLLSTFSQLSAELEGRVYGAGVLKHEPSEAKKIKLIMKKKITHQDVVEINEVYKQIDKKLREHKIEEARDLADNFSLSGFPIEERVKVIDDLLKGLALMRINRSPKSWKG
ncbi:MAG TPA: N-6 DNA methylase [Anaerolineales bacterium]|nr:N-6 DNA methylase [Anaerolineales bacterium]HRK88052.1 N-6 DNA methylase [Anaerolineales bacterium]